MKRYFRSVARLCVLLVSLSILPQLASALGNPDDDPDLPIDGGVSLLVAAGVGYGIKKYRDEQKKKKDNAIF